MRTLMLLVLTIVAVTGSRHHKAEILLVEIMKDVDVILNQSSKTNLSDFVKDVFQTAGCSEKHLCQAAMVMTNTHLNLSMIHRRLSAYANYSKHYPCSVPASGEHRMDDFLTKIKECCRAQYSKHLMHKRDIK